MASSFNSYIDCPAIDFWRELCLREGTPVHFDRGEYFFREGEVARYIGLILSGTLKYVAYGEDGNEHVLGLEFTGEFVADFPFSLRGIRARTSVVTCSPCEILCVPTTLVREMLKTDPETARIVLDSTVAVFGTVYDRYKELYALSPQQRYNNLISKHPNLFSLFPLRDIASFLNITPTHLSRLRKNI